MLSQTDVVKRVRELVAEITDVKRVYGSDTAGPEGLPGGFGEYPSILVYPGPTIEYIQNPGGSHTHKYECAIQVFYGPVGDAAGAAAGSTPFTDRLIGKFVQNVTLGGRATYARFLRHTGLTSLAYGGQEYIGYEIALHVHEQESITPEGGSA